MPAAASACGVPQVPEHHRPAGTEGSGGASDPGQLRHAQAPKRQGLAGEASSVSSAFHSQLLVLAEPGRAVVQELTDKALRRGVFQSVPDLIEKIEEYLAAHNAKGTTFIWTATTDQILAKVARGRVALAKAKQI